MTILVADLENDRYERIEKDYGRTGLELGAMLFDEYRAGEPVVIVSPSSDSIRFSGSAVFSVVYHSPFSRRMSASYSSYAPGLSLRLLGYDALVLSGKARNLSSLSIGSDGAERSVAVQYSGLSASDFESAARKNVGEVFLSVGRAAENGVLFSVLQSGGREIHGDGLGYVIAAKNIKGIAFPGFPRKDFLGNGSEERKVRRRMERGRIAKKVRKEGGGIFIDAALRLGFLPVKNYSRRYDPRAYFLDGKSYNERYGIYRESCQDCVFACYRRRQDNSLLPSWRESAALGPNLGFFGSEEVAEIADAVRAEGLSATYTGAVLGAISEKEGQLAVDDCIASIHLMGEGRVPFTTLLDIPGSICLDDGSAVPFDLRGSFPAALASIFSIPVDLCASMLIPARNLGIKSSAVMALYEGIYSLALLSEGYSPMCGISEWWGRFPSILYNVPSLARIIAHGFRAFGKKSHDLAARGLCILSLFSSDPVSIPDAFTLNPASALPDGCTVPYTLLVEAYEAEKDRLERAVKSRSEKRVRPSSRKSTAVGPDDERGRDGEPGLTT